MSDPVIAAASLVVVLLATPMVMAAARRTDIVDRPGPLKPQSSAVPYLGGVAVFLGLSVGAAAGRPSVLLPLALALVLGVADDRFDLAAAPRLAGQLAIGLAVAATSPVHLPGVIGTLLVVVVAVLAVNGVNLIDGLDLLAAGVCLVGAAGLTAVVHGSGRQLGVALVAALVGFLVYNRPPARIYLGDGGSYLLGTAIAVLVADAWAPGLPLRIGLAALARVAVPVAGVAFAVVRRARSGRPLLEGDRGHPYDRLVARGWPRPAASLAYVAVQAGLVAAAVAVARSSTTAVAVAVDAAGAIVLVALAASTGAFRSPQEADP